MSSATDRLSAALSDRYTIERELGAGGMATVYLADDLKHDRKVAVKVLRPELAAVLGAERFVQEIKTTANLQHPHILPLFDSGEADSFLYYVMPYIEGETLRDKLNRETQLGIEEAVKITTEVADALDYAHRNNVIHRDIKPENILLHDGRPMVADFGIALALSAAAAGRMTETGLSLGTPHYMSPEQAMGERDIDARTDVYALGCVLYEMLAGEPPFDGPTAQAIVAKVMASEPEPVTMVRKTVPPHVAAVIGKALQKLPADRFRTAGELHAVLSGAQTIVDTSLRAGPGAFPRRRRWLAALGGALAAGAVLGGLGMSIVSRDAASAPVVRFPLTLPPGHQLVISEEDDVPFALSPDGTRIVYAAVDSGAARSQLYLRRLDQTEPIAIAGTDDAVSPFFSPDGEWIGFVTEHDNELKKVPIGGGTPITLADDVDNDLSSASWGDDGYIVYVNSSVELSRVSGAGGVPQPLLRPDVETAAEIPDVVGRGVMVWPSVLPGGEVVLSGMCRETCARADLVAVDLESGTADVVVPDATRGLYLEPGYVVYRAQDGAVFGAPFDLAQRKVTGSAVPLLDGVLAGIRGGLRLSVSRSGTIVYLPGEAERGLEVVEVDRAGRETLVIAQPGGFRHPRWSPSRDRVALTVMGGNTSHIWIYDVASETLTQLTFEGYNQRASWSPDGRRVAFYSTRSGSTDLYWMPADGSGPAERVVDGEDTRNPSPVFWTRDGQWIVFDGITEEDARYADSQDIFAVRTEGDRTRQVAVRIPGSRQEAGAVSPNGEWIAYGSDEAGTWQVYIRPFMAPGGRWLVSTGAAGAPLWASDDEIVYRDEATQTMVIAKLEFGATVRVVQRTPLFAHRQYLDETVVPQFDVSRDGQRFLVLRRSAAAVTGANPVVVLNWIEEIEQRIAGGR